MTAIGAVASENTNLVSGGASSTGTLSYSPYPGKSAADTDSATMSFSDFLDMINPLEHIPVASSVYRAVTGETINTVSRIAGDTLYGGIFGLASAGLAALGAIGDEVVGANNDGKSLSTMVADALFGSDPGQATQIAATEPSSDAAAANVAALPPSSSTALTVAAATPSFQGSGAFGLQTPAPQRSPILEMPDFSGTAQTEAVASPPIDLTPVADSATPAATTIATETPAMPITRAATAAGQGMPIDRTKMPYGGVMDTAMMQSAQQNQTLALAMAGSASALQMQHSLRNSRFATNSTLTPTLSGTATNPMTTAAIQAPMNAQTQEALQNLLAELQASNKGVNPYKNTAQSTPVPGSAVDIAN